MQIKIDTDLITIVGTLLGIVGVFIAVIQTISARRAKNVYQTFCRDKGKEIVGLTRDISVEVVDACEIINDVLSTSSESDPYPHDSLPMLAAKINGARVLTSRLISYCERVNDEHRDKFGHAIFDDINKELPLRKCLALDLHEFPGLILSSGIEDKVNSRAQLLERKIDIPGEQEDPESDDSKKYQTFIIDHYNNPRNHGPLKRATNSAELSNPLCGDSVKIYVRWVDDILSDITFEASGCAICKASASAMTEVIKGKRKHEIEALRKQFHNIVSGRAKSLDQNCPSNFQMFSAIANYHARRKCAILPWRTLKYVLNQ